MRNIAADRNIVHDMVIIVPDRVDDYLETLRQFATSTAGIRRAGAAALDLAYVAAGRFDGFWEMGLQRWDTAAGALLVLEAGGLITDFDGAGNWLESGNVIAANPKCLKAMLQVIKPRLSR